MRALLGWVLALGLAVSPAMAKAGGAAGEDSPATAKTDKPAATSTTAPAATNAAAAKPAPANLESELDELRDLIQSQSKQIQEQNDQLKQEQDRMNALEEQVKASSTARETMAAAPATTTMTSAAPVSSALAIPAASTTAAASSPAAAAGAIAASPQGTEEKPSPLYFSIGGAHFTPGGFLDATNVFHSKATGNGIGTNFGAIPYNNSFPAAGLTEDRFSLQNSRITMRVDSKVAGGNVVGYLETDFLGNAPNGLNVTSNSNTLRMRVFFLDYTRGKFEVLFGQDWSMLTPNRNGIGFMPGDVFYSQDFDTNYQMGLTWERTAQIRFVLHPSKTVALGLSIENPEQYVPSSVTFPAAFGGVTSQVDQGGITSNVPNVHPDIVAKLAFDPKFGTRSAHFEVVGDFRTFRINNFSGTTNFGNTTRTGGAGAINSNVEIFKNFRLLETAFWSSGGGRLIANSGVPDFIVTPAASGSNLLGISPVHSGSGIAGFEYQTTPKLLLYGYYSAVYASRDFTLTGCGGAGTSPCGYGFAGSSNSNNRVQHEISLGWIQYFWRSANYGAVSMINQIAYLDRYPWDAQAASNPNHPANAHDISAWVDFRYTLP